MQDWHLYKRKRHQASVSTEERPGEGTGRRWALPAQERGLRGSQTCPHLDVGLLAPKSARK